MTQQYHRSGDQSPDPSVLAQYAMASLMGADGAAEWVGFRQHLLECAGCQEELAGLLHMLRETGVADLSEIDAPASFDLASLPPWLPDEPADEASGEAVLIIRRAHQQVRRIGLDLRAWLGAGQPRAIAGAFRGSDDYPQVRAAQLDDFTIALDLTRDDDDQSSYRLRVTVVRDENPFDQGGHRVTLHYEAQSRSDLTDGRGCVIFSDVPLSTLGQIQLTVDIAEI